MKRLFQGIQLTLLLSALALMGGAMIPRDAQATQFCGQIGCRIGGNIYCGEVVNNGHTTICHTGVWDCI